MVRFLKKNKLNISVLFVFSTLTLLIILFHENWRDEAQSWLIARDLSFIDIFRQMKYEGHPCLWHFIIAIFAKLGFPYITQNIIAWIIMCLSAGLVLFKSPFDKFTKILIICSAPFIYFYTVIARSYCLIPLALSLIAITYKNRKKRPIQFVLSITLLAHTHVLMLGVVGVLYSFFFFEEIILKFKNKNKEEKRNIIFALIIAILGLLLLFVQLSGCLKANTTTSVNNSLKNKLILIPQILQVIMNRITGIDNIIVVTVLIVISIMVIICQFLDNKKIAIMQIISISYQIFVYVVIYKDLMYQKSLTALLIFIFYYWIQKEENNNKNNKCKIIFIDVYLIFILLCSFQLGLKNSYMEISRTYSAAEDTGKFINENINDEAIFITSNIPFASSIIPYINDAKFWNPQLNDYYTFCTWDEKYTSKYTIDEFIYKINQNFCNQANIYFIYCYNWNEEVLEYFKQQMEAKEIYKSERELVIGDEYYIIYKLYN